MRILVTRPARDAERTAARLKAMGHEALCAPVMTIAATDIPAPASDYDVLVVTSANGADRLTALPGWEDRIVYAVGPRTADAIRMQGMPRDLHIAAGDAVSLVGMITAEQPSRSRVLHITGVNHKAEPDASLRAAGFPVSTWTAYDAVAATILPGTIASALSESRLDAALHYSRRSVETLLCLLSDRHHADAFHRLKQFCLSEDIAQSLRSRPIADIFIAQDPSEASLLDLLGKDGRR